MQVDLGYHWSLLKDFTILRIMAMNEVQRLAFKHSMRLFDYLFASLP